jgi:O-antigen/teichoic acid export membrane protein
MGTRRAAVSLGHSVLWFGGSYGVAIVAYLGLSAVASRLVGEDLFGYFLVVVTATTLLGQLGLAGVHRSGLREAARLGHEDDAKLAELREGVRAVSFVALPLTSVVSFAGAWVMLAGTPNALLVAGLTAALVLLTGQQKLLANYLRGFGHLQLAGMLEGRSGGALVASAQAALLLVVWVVVPGWGLVGALAAMGVGYAIPVAAGWVVLSRHWQHTQAPARPWAGLRTVLKRDWRFVLSQAGAYCNSTLDLWLAAAFLPAVGASMFGAGQRLAQLLMIPMTSLQVVFSPAISRLAVDSDRHRLQSLLRTGSSLATGAVALLWVPMMVIPAFVLSVVFGSSFSDAAPVLMLLATSYLINALSGLSGVTLSMSHQEGWVAKVHWCGLTVRVVLGIPAALLFGMVGLATTSMLATVTVYGLMWWQARRRVGVSTHATLRPNLRLLGQVAG